MRAVRQSQAVVHFATPGKGAPPLDHIHGPLQAGLRIPTCLLLGLGNIKVT